MNIYNKINYDIRESGNLDFHFYLAKYRVHWRAEFVNEGTIQQTISCLIKTWLSYQKAKKYYLNRNQYAHVPNVPGYKHDARDIEIILKIKDVNLLNDRIELKLTSSTQKKFNLDCISFKYEKIWGHKYKDRRNYILEILRDTKQIRILWSKKIQKWLIKIIYDKTPKEIPSINKNVMAIDIGLNNLCALSFRYGLNTYLINGRPLKSYNSYANYQIDQIQSYVMKNMQSSKMYHEIEEIRIIRAKRDNFITNYFHKASRNCVDIALREKCRVIVIGDITGIKQGNKNRSFVQIPLLKFVEMIKYKAELSGMSVVMIEEAYTSISSAIDLEEIKYGTGRAKRRICRGLFICNQGIMINSDVNGSLNILRKFLNIVYSKRILAQKNGFQSDLNGSIPEVISIIRDKGFVVDPIKLQIFKKFS